MRSCFNPHPSFPTGATRRQHVHRRPYLFQSSPVVSDGCNPTVSPPDCRYYQCFNPHPSFPTGATPTVSPPDADTKCVSILTRRFRRVQRTHSPLSRKGRLRVSILTRRFRRVQRRQCVGDRRRAGVSILTRRFRRVQLPEATGPRAVWLVSILTRRFRRVQHRRPGELHLRRPGFNPHPSFPTGATSSEARSSAAGSVFQSSPVVSDGCNVVGVSSSPTPCRCFNPHPSFPTGATVAVHPGGRPTLQFQSSPVVSDGCNEARVIIEAWVSGFQSSPVVSDGCNLCADWRQGPG